MRGSEHNDTIENTPSGLTTKTNQAGGTLGGISTGAPIDFKCAFKPVSTHFKPQQTVSVNREPVTFQNEGRHDPCVVPRAVPIVEAMTALVLADHALRTQTLQDVTKRRCFSRIDVFCRDMALTIIQNTSD